MRPNIIFNKEMRANVVWLLQEPKSPDAHVERQQDRSNNKKNQDLWSIAPSDTQG